MDLFPTTDLKVILSCISSSTYWQVNLSVHLRILS